MKAAPKLAVGTFDPVTKILKPQIFTGHWELKPFRTVWEKKKLRNFSRKIPLSKNPREMPKAPLSLPMLAPKQKFPKVTF